MESYLDIIYVAFTLLTLRQFIVLILLILILSAVLARLWMLKEPLILRNTLLTNFGAFFQSMTTGNLTH